jgi:hypothetical protein
MSDDGAGWSPANSSHGSMCHAVEVRAIDVPTAFKDFDDYWTPFLGG